MEELSVIHNGCLVSDYNKLELKAGDVCHGNLHDRHVASSWCVNRKNNKQRSM